jgi:cytochrome c oxidase assembly protein subunit 15
MISEALLGAVLVKGKLVTLDDSVLRLFVMSLHQINSFMLTGITYLFYISVNENKTTISFKYNKLILLFLILPLTGAVAALSTTLFPSISLWQGILSDFSSNQHLFIQLRILHPLIAVFVACGFIYFCVNRNLNKLALEFSLALAVGLVTLLTLSPVYLKLAHLLIAHLLWARLLHALVNLPDSNNR